MKKVFLLILFGSLTLAQGVPQRYQDFIHSLLSNDENISRYVLPEELALSIRLGISYEGVKNKFLISVDIPQQVKDAVKEKQDYFLNYEKIDEHRSILHFNYSNIDSRSFFFYDSLLISRARFYSSGWSLSEFKYIRLYTQNLSLTTEVNSHVLDAAVYSLGKKLGYTDEDFRHLEKNKIYYYFCKDEKENEKLTGFVTKGMYYLPYDYIISAYNFHLHELVHLLINYKLRHLPLYTLPLLQEGAAVALGGRGGLMPSPLLDMGRYEFLTGFIDLHSLMDKKGFYENDASLTYPAAGAYNIFLMDQLGVKAYLELYRKYSSNEDQINKITISTEDLPSDSLFIKEIKNTSPDISFFDEKNAPQLPADTVIQGSEYYLISVKDTMLYGNMGPVVTKNYISSKFKEIFPGRKYNGEDYLITASSNEVSFYNLITNTLVAKYSSGFSLDMKPVKKINGRYIFKITRSSLNYPEL